MNWQEFDYKSPALIGVKDESHGGEDVPILAKGPWAHLFTGMYHCVALWYTRSTIVKTTLPKFQTKPYNSF